MWVYELLLPLRSYFSSCGGGFVSHINPAGDIDRKLGFGVAITDKSLVLAPSAWHLVLQHSVSRGRDHLAVCAE